MLHDACRAQLLAASPCTRDSPATVDVVLEVERLGRVRFTLVRFRERRFGRYFWTCDRAVLAE